jgi:hypothetical protein
MNDQNNPEKPKDRHLDIPSEANQDKHANFFDDDAGEQKEDRRINKERKEQWEQGLREGKQNRESEKRGSDEEGTLGIP